MHSRRPIGAPSADRGYVTLGDVAGGRAMLRVACNRCDRNGRLPIAGLLARHGAAFPVPELRRVLAADCERMIKAAMHDPCGVHFPDLA